MDWNPCCYCERDAPTGRRGIGKPLDVVPRSGLVQALGGGAVVWVRHAAFSSSAPLHCFGVRRVIALGVLHSGASARYRTGLDEARPTSERRAPWRRLVEPCRRFAGGTPFGDRPLAVSAPLVCQHVPCGDGDD